MGLIHDLFQQACALTYMAHTQKRNGVEYSRGQWASVEITDGVETSVGALSQIEGGVTAIVSGVLDKGARSVAWGTRMRKG